MSILKTIVPKPGRTFATQLRTQWREDRRQRALMVGSLCLLLLALCIVLWRNRDFWVGDSFDAESDQPTEVAPEAPTRAPAAARQAPPLDAAPALKSKRRASRTPLRASVASPAFEPAAEDQSPVTVTSRTVLPPLDVEVIAGDTHHKMQPGNNSVHVDLQPAESPLPAPEIAANETAANVTRPAAERIQISSDASNVVTSPVRPSYPLLARQMRVQGRVILQALIGRDGAIQNLRLVSGPPILASAAEDAVRQWRFKPHIQGNEAVETEAKITVNFTISTN
jgi:TonB family protein